MPSVKNIRDAKKLFAVKGNAISIVANTNHCNTPKPKKKYLAK
jgi:ribosomal protein L35